MSPLDPSPTALIEGILQRGDRDAFDALRCSEPSFTRAFLRTSPDAVSLLSPSGVLRFMNQNGLKLLGFGPNDEIAGLSWESLWPLDTRGAVNTALRTAAAGEVTRYASSLGYLNAPNLRCFVTICPITGSNGAIEGLLAIVRPE